MISMNRPKMESRPYEFLLQPDPVTRLWNSRLWQRIGERLPFAAAKVSYPLRTPFYSLVHASLTFHSEKH